MAVEITMPQLSDTMSEGRILTWLKKEGDQVGRGDALAEVATDKADLEIESFHEGVLLKIEAPAGTTVKVGSVIALVGEASESVSTAPAPKAAAPKPQPEPAPKPAPAERQPEPVSRPAPQPPVHAAAPNGHDGDRVKISPLARNIADSYGVDVSAMRGTGDGGRIVRRDIESAIGGRVDVEAILTAKNLPPAPPPGAVRQQQQAVQAAGGASFVPAQQPAPAPRPQNVVAFTQPSPGAGQSVTEPLSKMRTTIAQRMVESKTTIPHFYMTSAIRVDELARVKDALKPLSQYEGLTYNHVILRAVALALRAVPRVNAVYRDGNLFQPHDINIGIITAVPDGLLIPVLKHADQLPLADVIAESKALVQRARTGRPKADDLMGGTFSVSNMGMFPVESFSAIISPGQGGILAIGGISEEPVVDKGMIRPGLVMKVTLSVDHRIIDGIVAGEFLKELKRVLEEPILLLA